MNNSIKISFAITVSTEIDEFRRLINSLYHARIHLFDSDDMWEQSTTTEVVVLIDESTASDEVIKYVTEHSKSDLHSYSNGCACAKITKFAFGNLSGDFAKFKNQLNSMCEGEWIFQLDADEYLSETFLANIHDILENNSDIEAIHVPRINTVEGITQEDITKWGWVMTPDGWINFPDWQCRLHRNIPEIKWKNKVHEQLTGYKSVSNLPPIETFSIRHPKTIERQRKQNEFYETL